MNKLIALLMIVLIVLGLTGCNYVLFDTKYRFDYAIIKLPNGEVIEGKIVKWTDYDGEQLQIVMEDGNTYLVSSFYTTLISYGSERREDAEID